MKKNINLLLTMILILTPLTAKADDLFSEALFIPIGCVFFLILFLLCLPVSLFIKRRQVALFEKDKFWSIIILLNFIISLIIISLLIESEERNLFYGSVVPNSSMFLFYFAMPGVFLSYIFFIGFVIFILIKRIVKKRLGIAYSQKILDATFVRSALISGFIFAFVLYLSLPYIGYFNYIQYRDSEFYNQAIKNNNESLCEKMIEIQTNKRSSCYYGVAVQKQDEQLCNKVESPEWQKECSVDVRSIKIATKRNIIKCKNTIKEEAFSHLDIYYCLLYDARDKKDLSLCDELTVIDELCPKDDWGVYFLTICYGKKPSYDCKDLVKWMKDMSE